MKPQQYVRESHDQYKEREQRPEPHIQTQIAQLSAQQWVQLLHHGEGLSELPASLLEQLAHAAGNSNLVALLRQGGGGAPLTCLLDEEAWEGGELGVNEIQTAPPIRIPCSEWPEWKEPRLHPSKPGKIQNRG